MSGRSHFVHESEGVLSNMRFVKLDAAGNDFIAFDGRAIGGDFRPDPESVARWCDRRHGIGGDGVLILGEGADGADFSVVFLNPDGTEAFCGNGARAAFSWWRHMMGGDVAEARFTAVDPMRCEIGMVPERVGELVQVHFFEPDPVHPEHEVLRSGVHEGTVVRFLRLCLDP